MSLLGYLMFVIHWTSSLRFMILARMSGLVKRSLLSFDFHAYDDCSRCSYVVIDRKLCVSNGHFSCAFDTGTKKCESCELFRDYYNGAGSKKKKCKEKKFVDSWLGEYPPVKKKNCGPPFPFAGRAILYVDILLCHVPLFDACVVAYQMVDGKVKKNSTLVGERTI